MSGSSLHFVSFRMTALLVNGVRRGRSPRLTHPPKLKVSFRKKRSEMRNLQRNNLMAFLQIWMLTLVAKRGLKSFTR